MCKVGCVQLLCAALHWSDSVQPVLSCMYVVCLTAVLLLQPSETKFPAGIIKCSYRIVSYRSQSFSHYNSVVMMQCKKVIADTRVRRASGDSRLVAALPAPQASFL